MVTWIIGLSGAGKSVLGTAIYKDCQKKIGNIVFIDGDVIRNIFGSDLGYTIEDRRKNAVRISNLCLFLDSQGINVICSVLSLFHDSQDWNRENYSKYYQVYIDTPFEHLIARDTKNLYKKALAMEMNNVVGVDIEFPTPKHSDLVINNSFSIEHLLNYAPKIASIITHNSK